jgi:hypothetical protein
VEFDDMIKSVATKVSFTDVQQAADVYANLEEYGVVFGPVNMFALDNR